MGKRIKIIPDFFSADWTQGGLAAAAVMLAGPVLQPHVGLEVLDLLEGHVTLLAGETLIRVIHRMWMPLRPVLLEVCGPLPTHATRLHLLVDLVHVSVPALPCLVSLLAKIAGKGPRLPVPTIIWIPPD